MVPSSIGGSARLYIFLLLPTLGFLNQYFFIYSFVSDHWQYLACLGIIVPCASGIALLAGQLRLASLAGAWNYSAVGRITLPPHLAAKPDVYQRRNAFSDDYCS